MQGTCIDSSGTALLVQGKIYYLFQNGPLHYYVSNFNNVKSHMGCFQSSRFELINISEPTSESENVNMNVEQLSLF